jgi:hypothetical protein
MKILCNWCNTEKEKNNYNASSLGNLAQGKKIYCIDCKSKYQKEIDDYTNQQVLNKKFLDKHFALKNGNPEAFKKYLLNSMKIVLEKIKLIDIDSYNLAIELKKEAAILKNKRHQEKRKLLRKINPEYKNHLSRLSKERYKKNGESEKRKQQKKEWNKKNKDKVLNSFNNWKKENPEKYKLKCRMDKVKQLGLSSIEEYEQYLLNNKIERENKKIEKQKEKEKTREIKRQEKIRLKELKRIADNEKRKKQRKIDKQYQIMDTLRCRTRKILKIQSANKTTNMAKLIGCSGKELAERFISMGYDSNTCHIDHIIPMSVFDLTIPEHQYIACNYLNLQPLNITDNLIKSDSLIDNWQDKIKEICNHLNIDHTAIIDHINKNNK